MSKKPHIVVLNIYQKILVCFFFSSKLYLDSETNGKFSINCCTYNKGVFKLQ